MSDMNRNGFTLIELSIVLVIIGLIVGGILVGRDLILAASLRAQTSQIDQYQAAVRTFQGKYNCLPGDCINAVQLGFPARGPGPGDGDGNGVVDGERADGNFAGEPLTFWVDLSAAHLVSGNYTLGIYPYNTVWGVTVTGSGIDSFLPPAAIGPGNYVYIYADAYVGGAGYAGNGINYFGVAASTSLISGYLETSPDLTALQASVIDAKIDDGYPQSGRVLARLVQPTLIWAGTGNALGPFTTATVGSASTCFDNSTSADGQTAVNGNPQHYSTEMSGGSGLNCALSFQFQ
jgi:prepilin-type N-terminal cleavage/methylation domain-containing protein